MPRSTSASEVWRPGGGPRPPRRKGYGRKAEMTLLVFPGGFLSWLERVALVVLGVLGNVLENLYWDSVHRAIERRRRDV